MKPRLAYDQAWKRGTIIYKRWYKYLEEDDPFNAVGRFLATHFYPREWCEFDIFPLGGFNVCFQMVFTDSTTAIIRFPFPGIIMFPEEKVHNEVRVMQFILEQSQESQKISIPVPSISHWEQKKESPANLGPFIIMEYIEHKQSICRLLEGPESDPTVRPVLNLNLNIVRLRDLYRKLAKIVLALSIITLNKIGSIGLDPENKTWKVLKRPLSYSMNEVVQLGTVPRSKIPNSTYSESSSYFDALAELQLSHLISQRNDSIDSEDDCRRKFVARLLFRRLIRDQKLREKWLHHETGPFPIWCDDFRPENVLVDEAENIIGVVDWEFTYTAPVEFSHAPPWWLLLEKPEYWSKGLDDWCLQYDKRLETFLQAMNDCENEAIHAGQLMETQRLSGPMRDSWESGNFWIMYAARNNFSFDSIYWQKIDRRFFGPTQSSDPDNFWKERLHLLTPKEKDYIDECVKLKFEEMDTRPLAWDPDEYTRAYEDEWVE
ncbi:Aminoglycoside phosphotransferase [Penicillium griseofulvum]|uniref:Aminoglycoside phosphotransferase n=1 Tax=Penicillium patulum TaxID=5078 RepID=A0A135LI28_PENPA|nr:Aminoglycoside phosphotransferase [Penicillium griseofulvum]KXG48641.1 Aminoglycoside phosphotransferase [Penicillium griseofulvum]